MEIKPAVQAILRMSDDEIVATAWPADVPEGEAKAWATMSENRRSRALNALRTTLAIIEDRRSGSRTLFVKQEADRIGISTPRLYSMMSTWKKTRSLLSFGTHSGSAKPRRRNGLAELKNQVRLLLAENPDADIGSVMKGLNQDPSTFRARSTIRRILIEERALAPRRMKPIRVIAIDSAGMDLLSKEGRRLRLHAVVDVTNLRIISHAISDPLDGMGYASLIRRTLDAWEEYPVGCETDYVVRIIDRHHPPATFATGLVQKTDRRFERRHSKHPGRYVVKAIGERVGGVCIGTGFARDGQGHRSARSQEMPVIGETISAMIADRISSITDARLPPDQEIGPIRLDDVLKRCLA